MLRQSSINWNEHNTHGRENEIVEIRAILKQIDEGAPSRIVAITGPSGVGKSVLVTEGILPAARGGYTASGKFDQFLPQTPYAAVLRCLRGVFHAFFFNPETPSPVRAANAQDLIDLVGPNREILCGAIPELTPLLHQDSTPSTTSSPLHTSEVSSLYDTRNRFHSLFSGILAMVTREKMVTLFIDDLQWADEASIDLIAALVENQLHRLLVIATSREPTLPQVLGDLPFTTVFPLNPFAPHQALDYVRAVLNLPYYSANALSNALHARAGGNPFFFTQLLRQAIGENVVAYDPARGEWIVDTTRIPPMVIASSDVVEFLLSNFTRLPSEIVETLRVAACLGSTFALDTLEAVVARLQIDINGLYLAEAEGFVVREPVTALGCLVFHFSHDRVMQAAHAKNSELQLQQIHLVAGEELLKQSKDLYAIANHFSKAISLISTDKLMGMCSLFLKAANNAKLAAAFDGACRYAQVGLRILAMVHQDWKEAWDQHYEITYRLSMIVMVCAFTNGNRELSNQHYDDIQQHATLVSAMLAVSSRMILLVNESQFSEAIDLGCEAITRMALPGITLPRHPSILELNTVLTGIDNMLQNSTAAAFLNLPPLDDPLVSTAATLLTSTSTASYFYDASVFAYSSSLMVQITLQHGLAPQATPGLAIYGLLCSSITGNCKRAYEIGEVAMRLCDIHGVLKYQCQVYFLFASLLNFYHNHIRENIPLIRRGLTLCTQAGNTLFAAFCAVHLPVTRLWKGDPLEDVAAESINALGRLGAQCRFADGYQMISGALYCARSLMGVATQKDLEAARANVSPFGIGWSATLRVKAHSLLHKYNEVLADEKAYCQNLFEDIKGQMHIGMHYFHYSLTLASLYFRDNPPGKTTETSAHYIEQINKNMVVLRKWATNSRINCEHRRVLIEAELAHIAHSYKEALELYEKALRLAQEREFYHYSAIILERMANYFERTDQADRARETLTRSIDGYLRWGACAVVAVLVAEHPELLPVKTLMSLDSMPYTVPVSASGTDIDMNTVLECSSLICENLNLCKLVINFLSQIVTSFQAAYGCIILTREDEKCVAHVQWSRQQTGIPCATLLTPPVPVSETFAGVSSMVCCSRAVRCALLMKRTVIVNDLQTSGIFADAYFSTEPNSRARSLVCMPLLLHGVVRALAYLECDSVFPFTIGNLQTLQLMCAQASIALENSRLIELEMLAREDAEAATAEKDSLLQEMQASEQRYQVLAQSIPQLIWTCSRPGGCYMEWVNNHFIEYIGCEVHGDVWSQYVHPDDLAKCRAAWVAFLANPNGSPFNVEFRIRGADGTYQWFLNRAVAAHDSKGNAVRWYGTSTNIEEQKRTLDQKARLLKVELSEKHYRTLAEALPQLVWTSLPDGRVNYYNAKWQEFSGVVLEEGVIMGWWSLVHPDDLEMCRRQFARSTRKYRGFEVECRLRRHDGEFRWFLVRAVRVKDNLEFISPRASSPVSPCPRPDNGDEKTPQTNIEGEYYCHYFGTGTDIDDQKKAEVSLIDARKAAERMAEMKSQWVANMSHELRTPSNGILGMLDLLMDTPLNAEQKDYVATMRRSTNVLLTVISDILDFRRNETRQVKLQAEPFSVHGVMEDVCEILFPLAAQKNVELVHVVAPDVPRTLLGDAARLRQVLVNLINNSIKFSNENGGHVEVTCQLTTFDQEDSIPLSPMSDQTALSCASLSPKSSPESSPEISPLPSPRLPALKLQDTEQASAPTSSAKRRSSVVFTAPLATSPPTVVSANVYPPTPALKPLITPSPASNIPSPSTPLPGNFPSTPDTTLSPTLPQNNRPPTPPPDKIDHPTTSSPDNPPSPTTSPPLTSLPLTTTPPPNTPATGAPSSNIAPPAPIVQNTPSIIIPVSTCSPRNVCLKFSVTDSGVGIPKDQQSKLFEPFFQVDSSATRKYGGTGLGLAISRQIVAALGGRIWVQSEEGCGSTFSFTSQFSCAPPTPTHAPAPPSLPTIPEEPPANKSVTSPPRKFSHPSLSSSQYELPAPANILPQQVIMLSDRKGAVMRVAKGCLAHLIPSAPSPSPSPIVIADSASDLISRISAILSSPLPVSPSLLTPYIACVLEISDAQSINSLLSSLAPFLSRSDCVIRVVLITIPQLRSKITLPTTHDSHHHPPVVFLMKPLSESKLRTALSLVPSAPPTPTLSTSTICLKSPFHTQTKPVSTPAQPSASSPSRFRRSSVQSPFLANPSPTLPPPLHRRASIQSSTPAQAPPAQSTPNSPPNFAKSLSSGSLVTSPCSLEKPSNYALRARPLSLSVSMGDAHGSGETLSPPTRLSASADQAHDTRVRRALCAEDNVVNQKVIIFHLKKLGFSAVDIANDGSEAVEMVKSHPNGYYEFILMDLHMPVMDGFVATKLIREREAARSAPQAIVAPLPVIALTANVMPGVQQRCLEAGMDGYVSKPVQSAELLQVLKDLAILI